MADNTKKNYFYKPLDQVHKANPAFGETTIQDRNMLVAFILAIKYIYSYENGECGQRPKIENWLRSTDPNWYYSSSFDEPRCVLILNQFREDFKNYKDLDCFKCFADPSVFNIQTADPYNYYIFNETTETGYIFDLNYYFDCLVNKDGNLKDYAALKGSQPEDVPAALKKLEKAIIKNANTLAEKEKEKKGPHLDI